MTEVDIAHLRQWIGRSEEASDVVTPRLVDGLRATLDSEGEAVPQAIHWCLTPAIARQSQLGPDGHPARGGFLPPVPLPRRMWAGGALEFHDALRIGDRVTRRSRIADVEAKKGRSGTLCFVTVTHDYATIRGLAIAERQDIVYRGAESAQGQNETMESSRPEPRWRRTLSADAVMLFRYSALTFNGHRIHYDRTYCREVENYPGLVVHGPLQATLLLAHAAAARSGMAPRRFDFRAVRPLFDGTPFSLNAVETENGLSLWIADDRRRATMTATAQG
ncbi:MAG TPA: MaoC family dehydratase N-terminal domain-containing protein [Stellaceae bacterium]|jgi:3-methylfumaryl-CoA hydratase|nr:MaoC family dehydratase N-terminal domain-containing protein [Stellaceae bacterium]